MQPLSHAVKSQPLLMSEISTDPTYITLTQKIAKRALLKATPEATLFTIGQTKLSVVNHTDQKITFNASRKLLINEQSISTFTEDDCQIIAYHLEAQPLMICFEQKDILAPFPGNRFYSHLTWNRVDDNTPKVLPEPSFYHVAQGLNLMLENCIANPIARKQFIPKPIELSPEIDENMQKHLQAILAEIAPRAILTASPTWIEETSDIKSTRILNFTSHSLTLVDGYQLKINDEPEPFFVFTLFSTSHCCAVAYQVKDVPNCICLEVKNLNNTDLLDRVILIYEGNEWQEILAHELPNECEGLESILALPPKYPSEANLEAEGLLQTISKDANLKKNPHIAFYESRRDVASEESSDSEELPIGHILRKREAGRTRHTIVNHTSQEITFDVNHRLCINDNFIFAANAIPSHTTAYHPFNSLEICIEHKYENNDPEPTVVCELNKWSRTLGKSTQTRLFAEQVHQEVKEKAFKMLWLAGEDEASTLSANKIPRDLLSMIINLFVQSGVTL
jgi:hypothetical protein